MDYFENTRRGYRMENPWLKLGEVNIHPDDEEALEKYADKLTGDYEVQKDLLPFPFFGLPEQAEVLILASNPGYVLKNREEQGEALFRAAFKESLEHHTIHPYLDPRFQKTKGYEWWHKRLAAVLSQFQPEEHDELMKKLMCVQLFPYHSKKFKSSVAQHLLTQSYSLKLVSDAINEEKEIVVLRAPWRDLLKKKLYPNPLEHFPFITVVKFQGQRPPSLSTEGGWIQPAQFERIVKRLRASISTSQETR